MMEKIHPAQLKDLFLEAFEQSDEFIFISGVMPFLIKMGNMSYYIYIKNISSAYFKDRPDVTRAQLPYREDFEEIAESGIPLIFLGYDKANDVAVCWNPQIVRERLNAKSSVSLYSRTYFQNKVRAKEFLPAFLTNGDKLILFKRRDIVEFFQQIDFLFEDHEEIHTSVSDFERRPSTSNRIQSITDPILIRKITPALKADRLLEAITICMDYYSGQYNTMKLKDWSKAVRDYYYQMPKD